MAYLVKSDNNNNLQVNGKDVSIGICFPNKFFILDTIPSGLSNSYVEIPSDVFAGFKYFEFDEIAKMGFDPFNGEVEMIPIDGDKYRRSYLKYNSEQKLVRKTWFDWIIDQSILDALSSNKLTEEQATTIRVGWAELSSNSETTNYKKYFFDNLLYDCQ